MKETTLKKFQQYGAVFKYNGGFRYIGPGEAKRASFWRDDILRTDLSQRLLPGARPWFGDGSV